MKHDEETPQVVLEELSTLTIIYKTIVPLLVAVLVFLVPYSSLDYLWPALGIVVLNALSLFFSLKLRNAKLYFIYYFCIWMLVFLMGLRQWEFSPGLSWTLVLTMVPGFALAAILPVACRDISEAIYRGALKPNSTFILLFLIVGITGLIGLILLWKLTSIAVIWEKRGIVPLVIGYLEYFGTLNGLQSGLHLYLSGRFQKGLNHSPQ